MSSDFSEKNQIDSRSSYELSAECSIREAYDNIPYTENKSLSMALRYFRHTIDSSLTLRELSHQCNDLNQLYHLIGTKKSSANHDLPIGAVGLFNLGRFFDELNLDHKLNFLELDTFDLMDLEIIKAAKFLELKKFQVRTFIEPTEERLAYVNDLALVRRALINISAHFPKVTISEFITILNSESSEFKAKMPAIKMLANQETQLFQAFKRYFLRGN